MPARRVALLLRFAHAGGAKIRRIALAVTLSVERGGARRADESLIHLDVSPARWLIGRAPACLAGRSGFDSRTRRHPVPPCRTAGEIRQTRPAQTRDPLRSNRGRCTSDHPRGAIGRHGEPKPLPLRVRVAPGTPPAFCPCGAIRETREIESLDGAGSSPATDTTYCPPSRTGIGDVNVRCKCYHETRLCLRLPL